MKRFSDKNQKRSANFSACKLGGIKTKSLLSCLLVLAMIMTMLPMMTMPAFAIINDYTITNGATSGFDVKYVGATTNYASFSTALAACGTTPKIIFGSGSDLTLNSSSAGNVLISGTYSGSVIFTVTGSSDKGLVVPSGVTANFNALAVLNTSTSTGYTPVNVNSGGILNVGTGTNITTAYTSTSTLPVVSNSGTLNVTGGTVCGDSWTRTAVSNNTGCNMTVSAGLVKSVASSSATGISNGGTVTVSGGLVTALAYGIAAEGMTSTVAVHGGVVEATGSAEGCAIMTRNGNVTVTDGTVQATGAGACFGIYYTQYSSTTGGVIDVSGGTVSSTSASNYYGAIVLGQSGTTNIHGNATVIGAKNGICYEYSNDDSFAPNNTITISGGTVESTDTTTTGAAVNISSKSLSTVNVSGGTLKSANDNTVKLVKGTAATAKIVAYGLNIYRSSEADLSLKGVIDTNDSNKRVLIGTNKDNATVTASSFNTSTAFDAWTKNSEGSSTITGAANGATIASLSADSNANVYLKSKVLDTTAPSLTKGTATRTSDAVGSVTFTYYYTCYCFNI